MQKATRVERAPPGFAGSCLALVYWVGLLLSISASGQINYSQAYTFTTFAGGANIGTADGAGSAARFHGPLGTAVDSNGNVYVADNGNHTIRMVTPAGLVKTMAGYPEHPGSADGANSAARFSGPSYIALDSSGNLFVTDSGNNTIRKMTTVGTNWFVTTIAGQAGVTGANDGSGASATFYSPRGLALDNGGNIYVSDAGNSTIRRLAPAGTNWLVTTIAGAVGIVGRDDGTNSSAHFGGPFGLAVDAASNIYVADLTFSVIRRITPIGTNWVVTTIAGSGMSVNKDGTNASAGFFIPAGMALGSGGELYVSGGGVIRKTVAVGTNWVVTTVAGSLTNCCDYANGTGPNARFDNPQGIAADSAGNLYIGDLSNNAIRKITSAAVVSTIAGPPPGNPVSADGTGNSARFLYPGGVATDNLGNVYVADSYNETIRKITAEGVVSTVAGLPGSVGYVNGAGSDARFTTPQGVAADSAGYVYVADTENCVIRKITPAGLVTTLAGAGGYSGTITDGTNSEARFAYPQQIALDNAGAIYVADSVSHTIRKVAPFGTNWVVTTIAGSAFIQGTNDGVGTNALFKRPYGVAIGPQGDVYVADSANSTIRRLAPSGGGWVVSTIAGSAGNASANDGTNGAAGFSFPLSLAVDGSGNLYVTDSGQTIRKITPIGSDWVVSTLAGSPGNLGSADGTGQDARFYSPFGIAVDSLGALYVADSGNNTIRKGIFTFYTATNPAPSVPPPMNGQLNVTLLPPEANGQWRFAWEANWHASGQIVSNLVQGNYPVVLRQLPGYVPIPPELTVPVTNGGVTSVTNQYYSNADTPGTSKGALTVNIGPGSPPGDGWRFLGESDSDWRPAGTTVTNLVADTYFVEFRPVTNYSTPVNQQAQVSSALTTVLSANYLLAQSPPFGVNLPIPVPTSSITNTVAFPYGFNGQLQCDARKGSGVAVQRTVVLSAAHLIFDDRTLSYVSQAWWFFQREAGFFEPEPIAARGWLLLNGYAAQRTNDLLSGLYGPDQSTPQSRNLDVAALYFPTAVAGEGCGGFLPSDVTPNTWLTSTSQKLLVGYPVDGSLFGDASIVPGRMYQIGPQPYPLSLAMDQVPNQQVYTAPWFLSYPGNSGGPLYVQLNGYYYPAAVYIGTLYNGAQPYASAVRAINSDVVSIITLASALGNSSTNGNGGVITVTSGQAGLGSSPYITVNLKPPEALAGGAGWRLLGDSNYVSLAKYSRLITSGGSSVTIQFSNITGWDAPPQASVAVSSNSTTIVDATYLLPANLAVVPSAGLSSSNYAGSAFNPVTWTLSNSGQEDLNWSAAKSANWFSLSPSSGTIAPGASASLVLEFNANVNSLSAGVHSDTITFSNLSSGLGNTSRSISVNVSVHPPITLSAFRFVDSGHVAMTLSGLAGKTYSIQRSANLTSWTDLAPPVTNLLGVVTFTNSVPPSFSKAFYRAKEL